MENKGAGNIVGSPNAPYINSLINAYGSASNYYALTHPSDPNYYPILGGSDFGINYNCASDCFDEKNLADEIEAAGETWAAYQQGGAATASPPTGRRSSRSTTSTTTRLGSRHTYSTCRS